MFTKFIHWPIFFASFVIGIVFIWISVPVNTTIYVYPTPDNIGEIGYRDKAKNCFEYNVNNVKCPSDVTKIKNIPVQMGNSIQNLPGETVSIGNTTVNKI